MYVFMQNRSLNQLKRRYDSEFAILRKTILAFSSHGQDTYNSGCN